jgi:histone acetyltransferase (RNA polymerase elongator complex component)
VIKGTPLEELYKTGRYSPLSLENAVALCSAALRKCNDAGINVIRMGLQPTEELEKPGTILSGPYHPAFRQLVDSSILLDKMRSALKNRSEETDSAVFQVNPKDLSAAVGQNRSNADILKKEFRLREIRILESKNILGRGEPILLSAF